MMIEIVWEDDKETVQQLVKHIVQRLDYELEVDGTIVVLKSGYRLHLDNESNLDQAIETVSSVMNEEIENGPDGWMGPHSNDTITVAIRDVTN